MRSELGCWHAGSLTGWRHCLKVFRIFQGEAKAKPETPKSENLRMASVAAALAAMEMILRTIRQTLLWKPEKSKKPEEIKGCLWKYGLRPRRRRHSIWHSQRSPSCHRSQRRTGHAHAVSSDVHVTHVIAVGCIWMIMVDYGSMAHMQCVTRRVKDVQPHQTVLLQPQHVLCRRCFVRSCKGFDIRRLWARWCSLYFEGGPACQHLTSFLGFG